LMATGGPVLSAPRVQPELVVRSSTSVMIKGH